MTYKYLTGTRYNYSMRRAIWVAVAIADILIGLLALKIVFYLP